MISWSSKKDTFLFVVLPPDIK